MEMRVSMMLRSLIQRLLADHIRLYLRRILFRREQLIVLVLQVQLQAQASHIILNQEYRLIRLLLHLEPILQHLSI